MLKHSPVETIPIYSIYLKTIHFDYFFSHLKLTLVHFFRFETHSIHLAIDNINIDENSLSIYFLILLLHKATIISCYLLEATELIYSSNYPYPQNTGSACDTSKYRARSHR